MGAAARRRPLTDEDCIRAAFLARAYGALGPLTHRARDLGEGSRAAWNVLGPLEDTLSRLAEAIEYGQSLPHEGEASDG